MMNMTEIREYLPHRYPFLLVDRVIALEKGKSIVAYKNVTINEDFFNGHFPDFPVMPGVLIIEAMAQVAGILGFKTVGKKPSDGSIYYFVGTEKLRFKRPVQPGDRLTIEALVIAQKRGIWKFDCKATVDEELVCAGTIICADREKKY